jgi:hypothetical protein
LAWFTSRDARVRMMRIFSAALWQVFARVPNPLRNLLQHHHQFIEQIEVFS